MQFIQRPAGRLTQAVHIAHGDPGPPRPAGLFKHIPPLVVLQFPRGAPARRSQSIFPRTRLHRALPSAKRRKVLCGPQTHLPLPHEGSHEVSPQRVWRQRQPRCNFLVASLKGLLQGLPGSGTLRGIGPHSARRHELVEVERIELLAEPQLKAVHRCARMPFSIPHFGRILAQPLERTTWPNQGHRVHVRLGLNHQCPRPRQRFQGVHARGHIWPETCPCAVHHQIFGLNGRLGHAVNPRTHMQRVTRIGRLAGGIPLFIHPLDDHVGLGPQPLRTGPHQCAAQRHQAHHPWAANHGKMASGTNGETSPPWAWTSRTTVE